MKYKRSPRYSDEFKREAVQTSLSSPQTQTALAAKLCIHPNTLSRWRKELTMDHTSSDKKIANDGPEKSVQELENEIKRLKKQLRRSQLETEILKKADEYFIKHGK
ncbi:transposase [Vreelandella alkaliphila]|uniref:transposase n=1 Tax=Halomonadaceae TaxID=28256 RepID=UPI002648ADE7|nr:transposase [Halomonas sp. KG2]WKD27364.1 transposase [Halomonas sp. KG2]